MADVTLPAVAFLQLLLVGGIQPQERFEERGGSGRSINADTPRSKYIGSNLERLGATFSKYDQIPKAAAQSAGGAPKMSFTGFPDRKRRVSFAENVFRFPTP